MKLIDILARELKSWPEECEAIEQDRHGSCLYKVDGPALAAYVGNMAEDADTAKVTRAQWQAAVDALEADPWTGEGLPPVGTVCEHFGTADHTNWIEVHVIGHGHVRHHDVAFFEYMIGTNGYTVSYSTHTNFRQLRTPDQIAAEEREKAINEMVDDFGKFFANPRVSARTIYEAGYRKQATND